MSYHPTTHKVNTLRTTDQTSLMTKTSRDFYHITHFTLHECEWLLELRIPSY